MQKYSYQALDKERNIITGTLNAESSDAVNTMLLNKGYFPYKIKIINESFHWSVILNRFNSVTSRNIIIFTKQFRTLFNAGVPTIELWQIIESQTEDKKLKNIIKAISKDVKEGVTLYDAFKKHPQAFSPLYCSIIKAGESSGSLSNVLARLTDIMEHDYKITSDIKSALRYPAFVIIFLIIAFMIQITFVIPKFIKVFKSRGIELPLPTRMCIEMYQFLDNYWYIILIVIAGTVLGFMAYLKTDQIQIKYLRDLILIKLPIFGPLFIKASMSRFGSIFSILHFSGVPILEAITILSGVINNSVIADEFNRIKKSIEQGTGIASPLKSAKYFPPMVINMVAIGEKSGKLESMLSDISVHYDAEVDYAMKGIGESISTFLTIGIAAVVGFFAFSIFLPMWDMVKIAP